MSTISRTQVLEGVQKHGLLDPVKTARLQLLLQPGNVSPADMKEARKLIDGALADKWHTINKDNPGWVESQRTVREFLADLSDFSESLKPPKKPRPSSEFAPPSSSSSSGEGWSAGKTAAVTTGIPMGLIVMGVLLAPFGL